MAFGLQTLRASRHAMWHVLAPQMWKVNSRKPRKAPKCREPPQNPSQRCAAPVVLLHSVPDVAFDSNSEPLTAVKPICPSGAGSRCSDAHRAGVVGSSDCTIIVPRPCGDEGVSRQFAAELREDLAKQDNGWVPYASGESYRHICRYQGGFFYRPQLALEYEWYWRVEPHIQLFCDLPNDPFRYMAENHRKYGFAISMNEISRTVPILRTHVRAVVRDFPQHLSKVNHLAFLSEDGSVTTKYYRLWSRFELVRLEWFRSEAYADIFNYLDVAGGFFCERWGDASVLSIVPYSLRSLMAPVSRDGRHARSTCPM
ncbi:glycosyltransferase family 15 protein [Dothistroma septosporum NZE10]|uniref:Glycosyltransferase family 15 protein n=1 Tax=Dothistroma septosporum (strain NZE10 / CBS 128990) TaxID=675120 RepID=N1PGW0_DOTSN|nr:glycosyltransferase family 15 protein [Dothistroma septosporum NZE10]